MMSRRGGPSGQVLLGIAVVGLFLYGFYSYDRVKTGLRLMEEKADRLKVQHETVSKQLQVLYEHKTRLEKAVQEEKTHHKKTKDDLTMERGTLEEKLRQVKSSLNEELSGKRSEQSKLEDKYQKVIHEKQTLKDELNNFQEVCKMNLGKLRQQGNQQRQECNNDIAQLKDEIADLRRRNAEMTKRLQSMPTAKGDHVKAVGRNRKKVLNEDQNLMQIAQPGENKRKAYFEVKSPVPDDQQVANARQLPPAQKEQVAPPIVKNQDDDVADTGDSKHGGAGADVVAGKFPNVPDGRIRDDLVNRSYARSFDDNVVDHVRHGAPDGVREDGNHVPVQVPAPAQKDSEEGVINQPGGLAGLGPNNPPDQALHQGRNFRRGHAEVPGQILNPVLGDNPDANIADDDGEAERAENEDQNEEQVNNPEPKQKLQNEQDDYNDVNREDHARDM